MPHVEVQKELWWIATRSGAKNNLKIRWQTVQSFSCQHIFLSSPLPVQSFTCPVLYLSNAFNVNIYSFPVLFLSSPFSVQFIISSCPDLFLSNLSTTYLVPFPFYLVVISSLNTHLLCILCWYFCYYGEFHKPEFRNIRTRHCGWQPPPLPPLARFDRLRGEGGAPCRHLVTASLYYRI